MLTKEQRQALNPINLLVFVLSLYVIIALIVDTFFVISSEMHTLLQEIDYVICGVFFIDFCYRFFTAKSKKEYMKWGWLDLISSIPTGIFLAGRLFRIFQLIRVIRAIRSIRLITNYFLKNKVRSAFTSAAILAFLTVIFSAIGILQVEKGAGQIKTAEDALWWSYVTITTVGYGDMVPVTTEGRLIAAVLMTVGVGLFGTFTAYVASWFVAKKAEEDEEEKIRELEEELRKRKAALLRKNRSGSEVNAIKKEASVEAP